MDLIAWELVPTDFVLMVLLPAICAYVWNTNKTIYELKGRVDVLLEVVAGGINDK